MYADAAFLSARVLFPQHLWIEKKSIRGPSHTPTPNQPQAILQLRLEGFLRPVKAMYASVEPQLASE